MDDTHNPLIARAGTTMRMGYEGQTTPRQEYLILKDFDIDLIYLQATGDNPRDELPSKRRAVNGMATLQYLLDHQYLELRRSEVWVLS